MENLNPGIRRTVAWLRSLGFNTVDSGDGETHDYGCDRPRAYVAMTVPQLVGCPAALVTEAERLASEVRKLGIPVWEQSENGEVWIQASYDPANGIGVLDLNGLRDDMLTERLR